MRVVSVLLDGLDWLHLSGVWDPVGGGRSEHGLTGHRSHAPLLLTSPASGDHKHHDIMDSNISLSINTLRSQVSGHRSQVLTVWRLETNWDTWDSDCSWPLQSADSTPGNTVLLGTCADSALRLYSVSYRGLTPAVVYNNSLSITTNHLWAACNKYCRHTGCLQICFCKLLRDSNNAIGILHLNSESTHLSQLTSMSWQLKQLKYFCLQMNRIVWFW